MRQLDAAKDRQAAAVEQHLVLVLLLHVLAIRRADLADRRNAEADQVAIASG